MTVTRAVAVLALGLLAGCVAAPHDERDAVRRELAPTGVLRAGINLGNVVVAQKDPAGGAPRGIGPDLAREMARQLGVPVRYETYDIASRLADDASHGKWDVAFLAIDPSRATAIDFSGAYMQVEATYLVRAESPVRTVEDVDRAGIRIAAGDKAAYTLSLQRTLRNARVVVAPTSDGAVTLLATGHADVAAGVKAQLEGAARRDPSLRVVEGRFHVTDHAVGIPKGRAAAAAWVRTFVEQAKADGFVYQSLQQILTTSAASR